MTTLDFAIGSFELDGRSFPGIVVDDSVHDISGILPGVTAVRDLFQRWDAALDELQNAVSTRAAGPSYPISDLHVLPPVQPVGQLFCAGANYRQHVIEMTVAHRLGRPDANEAELRAEASTEIDRRADEGEPYVWLGLPSAVSGAYDDVLLPDVGDDIDWELELAIVIGRRTHRVSVADARASIAGYAICNDITARTLVPRSDIPMMGTDWLRGKSQPTFFPLGPFLVPSRFVPDPTALDIELTLNGAVMQHASTADLLFGIDELISYTSSLVVMEPGDVLITGSPAGNGSAWGRYLTDGDVMEARITGLGAQRTVVRGPSGALPPWQARRSSRASDPAASGSPLTVTEPQENARKA